jgi:two-component system LytT family response regulator
MKIRALIADDEPLARERIRTLLAHEADIEVVAECADGKETVRAIQKLAPDLIFLDIQMPELSGFEVLQKLDASAAPAIIFVTAYDQYALQAFEVRALDYLMKPFDAERFRKALERGREQIRRLRSGEVNERLLALLEDLERGRKYLERLVIRTGGRVFFLRVDEIDWIEAAGNYVRLHIGAEEHLLRETMNSLEQKLDPARFARIHRSTMVNLTRIKELQPWFRGDYVVILRDGHQLTLSRSYRGRLKI